MECFQKAIQDHLKEPEWVPVVADRETQNKLTSNKVVKQEDLSRAIVVHRDHHLTWRFSTSISSLWPETQSLQDRESIDGLWQQK